MIRSVLSASGDEHGISEALGRRRLTDEEREYVRGLLVPEMLKHGLEADSLSAARGSSHRRHHREADVLLRIECRFQQEAQLR